jgi:hypothetical protein
VFLFSNLIPDEGGPPKYVGFLINTFIRRVHKIAKNEFELRHICLSVRPAFRDIEKLGSHWIDFYGI